MADIIVPIVLGVLFVGCGIVFYVKNFVNSKSKSNTTAGKGGSVTTPVKGNGGGTIDTVEDADKLNEREHTLYNGDRIKKHIEKELRELER